MPRFGVIPARGGVAVWGSRMNGLAVQTARPQRLCQVRRGVGRVFLGVLLCSGVIIGCATQRATASPPEASAWSVSPTADNSSSLEDDYLNSVSCSNATSCMAVGYYDVAAQIDVPPLTESWDGSSWTRLPNPYSGADGGILQGVSCADSTDCVAVGSPSGQNNPPLIESWNGTEWSIASAPPVYASLNGVSCATSTDCVAVGSGGDTSETIIEAWDGSTWTVIPSPNQDSSLYDNTLNSVSCTNGGDSCMAVGNYKNALDTYTLTEVWDGATWSIVPSPNQTPPTGERTLDTLVGVSCPAPNDCVAVGNEGTDKGTFTLIETWNGTTWSISTSPNPGRTPSQPYLASQLLGVSCSSTDACTAVGGQRQSKRKGFQPLAETWNGGSWSIVPTPEPSSRLNSLVGVSCSGASNVCLSAGTSLLDSGYITTLIEDNIPLTISTPSLPEATIGESYSATLSAQSGNAPYKWRLATNSPKLPKGLELNRSNGVISGTPTTSAMASTFTVDVVDTKAGKPQGQNTASSTFTIAVNAAAS